MAYSQLYPYDEVGHRKETEGLPDESPDAKVAKFNLNPFPMFSV